MPRLLHSKKENQMITAKIDVTKVDKARLFAGKNGAKYLDIVLIPNKNGTDDYGNDGFIKQGVTKEEREARVEMPIIGNYRNIGKPAEKQAPKSAPRPQADPDLDVQGDEVPF